MYKVSTKNTILTAALSFLILMAFSTPAHANFFPFLPKRPLQPSEYSKLEEKIEIYNNQAIELFEEGRFKEAQELWDKAIQIMERSGSFEMEIDRSNKDGVSSEESIDDIAIEDMGGVSEIEDIYRAAVSAFKKQKYSAAKKMFDRVEKKTPDYKATRNYLTILKHKIKQVQQSLSEDKFKNEALSRKAERGEWKKILQESEKELERKLTQQVEPIYKEALVHYKSRKFKLAKEYFQEIDSILPKYKDTAKYLSRVDVDIKADEQRQLKERYKQQALARKKEQEEWHRIIEESEQKLKEKMMEQAEPIYQEALRHYKERDFELAKGRFRDVEKIVEGYKSTAKYLTRIDKDMEKEIALREQKRLREYEKDIREKEIAQKREQERLDRIKAVEEKNRLKDFQREVAQRRKDREEWLKVLEQNEKERQQKLAEQAEYVYQEGMQYFKRREFEEARDDFIEVEQIFSDYKSTKKFLSKIDEEIIQEKQQQLALEERMMKRKLRQDQLVDAQRAEEERHFRAIESQKRVEQFKQKAMARKKQRDEWDRILQKNEAERGKRLNKEAGFVYKQALKAYKKQRFEEARSGFLEVQEILPGHKDSDKYLARIDQDIEEAELARREKEEKELAKLQQREALVLKKEEERQRKLLEEDQKKLIAKQKKQAEAVYKFAVSLYRKGEYVLAKDKFREVEDIVPDYRSTKKYLGRIDGDIANSQGFSSKEHELAMRQETRRHKVDQMHSDEKLKRLLAAEEDHRLKELKEESLARQRDRDEWQKSIKKIEAENKKRLKRQAEATYQEALRYYKAGWFEQAREAFEEVESAMPGYRSAQKYIVRSQRNIAKEGKLQTDSEIRIQEYLDREEKVLHAKSQRVDRPIPETNGSLVVKSAVEKREKEFSQQAEVKYREALDLYKANKFIEAKLKFIEIESFSPGYKATLDYLSRIDEKVSGQEMTNSRDRLIEQALLQREGSVQTQTQIVEKPIVKKAKVKKVKVSKQPKIEQKKKNPSLEDQRKALKAQRRSIHLEYDKRFKELYKKAVASYKSGSYEEAQRMFHQIEHMRPGYKRTASYLKKVNKKIGKGLQKKNNNFVAQSYDINARDDAIGKALDAFEQRK